MSTYFIHVHLVGEGNRGLVVPLDNIGSFAQAAQFAAKVSESLDNGESLLLDHDGEVCIVPADSVLFIRVTDEDEPRLIGGE